MSQEKIAQIIGILTDPFIEAPLLLLLLFLTKSTAPLWFLFLLIALETILPVSFLKYGLRKGFISDWETTEREQRHGLNLVCLLAVFLSLLLVFFSGDLFLAKLFFIFFVLMACYTLITFYWKISGHLTANTAFFLILNIFYKWRFFWLVFLIPLVAWARLVRRKHDLGQVIGGAILASVIILCGVSLLF